MRPHDTTKVHSGPRHGRLSFVLPALIAFATAYLLAMLLSFLGS